MTILMKAYMKNGDLLKVTFDSTKTVIRSDENITSIGSADRSREIYIPMSGVLFVDSKVVDYRIDGIHVNYIRKDEQE